MRYYGTITRWNDSRQFGAIREESMGTEVFAPLSAFTSLPRPPAEGQRVSFDIIKGRRGRDEAENICFASDCADETGFFASEPQPYKKNITRLLTATAVAALIAAGGWFGWDYWQQYRQKAQEAATLPPDTMVSEVAEKIKAERKAWKDAANGRAPAKAQTDSDNGKNARKPTP